MIGWPILFATCCNLYRIQQTFLFGKSDIFEFTSVSTFQAMSVDVIFEALLVYHCNIRWVSRGRIPLFLNLAYPCLSCEYFYYSLLAPFKWLIGSVGEFDPPHSNLGACLRGQFELDPLTLHQTRYSKIVAQWIQVKISWNHRCDVQRDSSDWGEYEKLNTHWAEIVRFNVIILRVAKSRLLHQTTRNLAQSQYAHLTFGLGLFQGPKPPQWF